MKEKLIVTSCEVREKRNANRCSSYFQYEFLFFPICALCTAAVTFCKKYLGSEYRLSRCICQGFFVLFCSISNSLVLCNWIHLHITRAHSFPWKILPNSVGQLVKFRGSPQQNRPNSAACHGLPFMSKLSSVVFRNFSY